MKNLSIRTLRVTAAVVGATALGAILSGTAQAADQGGSGGHYHSTPGSGRHSNPDHNYHNDLYSNSKSNSNSNSSLAKCGAGDDDTASRDDCSEENTYGLHHDRRHSYRSDDEHSGGLGSLF